MSTSFSEKTPSIFPGFSKNFLLFLLLTYFNSVLKSPIKNSVSTKLKIHVMKITQKITGNMVTYVSKTVLFTNYESKDIACVILRSPLQNYISCASEKECTFGYEKNNINKNTLNQRIVRKQKSGSVNFLPL